LSIHIKMSTPKLGTETQQKNQYLRSRIREGDPKHVIALVNMLAERRLLSEHSIVALLDISPGRDEGVSLWLDYLSKMDPSQDGPIEPKAVASNQSKGKRVGTIEEVANLWSFIIRRMEKNYSKLGPAYLSPAVPLSLDDETFTIGYPTEFNFVRAQDVQNRIPFEPFFNDQILDHPRTLKIIFSPGSVPVGTDNWRAPDGTLNPVPMNPPQVHDGTLYAPQTPQKAVSALPHTTYAIEQASLPEEEEQFIWRKN
jgi:hypothetical protein